MIPTYLHSPSAPFDSTEVTHPSVCYIGLGSNLADPLRQIASARASVLRLPGVVERAFSSLYRSKPMGPQNQPDYVNAVMAISTNLAPLQLLHALQATEAGQGRVRGERWGARTLDLDILLYDDKQIDTSELTIPHPGIRYRAFVLYPLFEIAPRLIIPGLGAVADLLDACPKDGLERIVEEEL